MCQELRGAASFCLPTSDTGASVTDTATGATRTYTNPPGQLASRADIEAFPLEEETVE